MSETDIALLGKIKKSDNILENIAIESKSLVSLLTSILVRHGM